MYLAEYLAEKERDGSETEKQCNSKLRPADAKRKLILEADDLTGAVERDTVYCKPCEKWIRLAGNSFHASNWYGHRNRKHPEIADCKNTQYVYKFVVTAWNLNYNCYRNGNWDAHRDRLLMSINKLLEEGSLKTEDSDDAYIITSSDTDSKDAPVQTRSSNRPSNLAASVSSRTRRGVFQSLPRCPLTNLRQ